MLSGFHEWQARPGLTKQGFARRGLHWRWCPYKEGLLLDVYNGVNPHV